MRISDINISNYKEYAKLWSVLLHSNNMNKKQSFVSLSDANDLLALTSNVDSFSYSPKSDALIAQYNQKIQAQAAALSPQAQPMDPVARQMMIDRNNAQLNWTSDINREIGRVLRENGITISEGENYVFKIGSDKRVRVEGSDETKAARIADAINNAKVQNMEIMSDAINTDNLSEHILRNKLNIDVNKPLNIPSYGAALTWTNAEKSKFYAGNNLYRWTGLTMNDLVFTDKGVFTKDGEDVYRLIRDSVNEYADSVFADLSVNLSAEMAKELAMRKYEFSAYASYAIKLLETVRVSGPENIKDYDIVVNYGKNGLF